MSLVAVYDALRAANVDQTKATEAVKAIETSLDEPWKRRMEDRIAKVEADIVLLKWMVGTLIVLVMANLTLTGAILINLAS